MPSLNPFVPFCRRFVSMADATVSKGFIVSINYKYFKMPDKSGFWSVYPLKLLD